MEKYIAEHEKNVHPADGPEEIILTAEQVKGRSSAGHEAAFVLDDSFDTYYETPETESNYDYMRFLDIDLRGVYQITSITLYMVGGGYHHYQIYASETGESYRKIAFKNDSSLSDAENGDRFVFETPAKAAYLRINLSYYSTGMQDGIVRLKVFGKKTGEPVPQGPKGISVPDFKDSPWKAEWDRFRNDPEYAKEKTLREIRAMVGRVLGKEWKDSFDFAFITADRDTYEIENGKDGNIVIRGTNGGVMASGLHYYLRRFCKVDYSPLFVSNMRMPETLPAVPGKIVKEIKYPLRYGLHVCSHSYTMAFWEWEKYETCLDWAAMCGVNLIMHMAGQEEILRRVLTQFGYTDTEVKEYLTGPAYFPWGCRNMSGFGGPLPDNWFADRVELGRRIHDRMQVFGMKPVLRGYYGAVPTSFTEKNPDAQVIHQGEWCRFTRPDTLKVYVDAGQRDYYREVADAFYKAQKEIFGEATEYFSADPFIEGGRGGNIDQARMFRTIQDRMLEHNPKSIWVMQKWAESLNSERLAGLAHKENVLVLDINSEITRNTDLTERNQLPWIWGLLHEFGGTPGLEANARAVSELPLVRRNSDYMAGVGMTSESFGRCPMIYELLWDAAWSDEVIDLNEWGSGYMERRYGGVNGEMKEAWSLLLRTVYSCEIAGTAETLIDARPTEEYTSTVAFGRGNITYDVVTLEKVLRIYIDNYSQFSGSKCYRYDLVDLARQVLANSSRQFHSRMMEAYRAGDPEKFDICSKRFLNLIRLQNDILDTCDNFQTGAWIGSARSMMSAKDDWTKDLFEWNARSLITTWGGKRAAESGRLRDYSYRSWAGITEDLYMKRWEMWINTYRKALAENTEPEQIEWFLTEWEWANSKSDEGFSYPSKSTSDKDLLTLVKEAYESYTVTNMR